ncbi:amino acid ABC transporter permease [Treponema parvum]|uniref:Amino acid ABC transporter permease n=1 Tax=Treponema parvum TaxID=138851 RepID=A0A975F730_9SPIR|nr:amino acid ABC transporter permease [Treponema parvum]QTQ15039.1 amino acid ABC transporter permease [Treponema parvum]
MRPFDVSYIWKYMVILLPFIRITLQVTFLSTLFGALFGSFLALGRLSPSKTARFFSVLYIHVIRCTPSIVLLFIVFYGLPAVYKAFTGITLHAGNTERFFSVVTVLSLLSAASMCELIRSAVLSVDDGQREAAFCCGMSKLQTAFLIVIPQAVPAAIPNFCNTVTGILKQGALAFTIGFIDIMGQTQIVINRAYGAHGLEAYIALAVIYWSVTLVIEKLLNIAEKYSSKGKNSLETAAEREDSWN